MSSVCGANNCCGLVANSEDLFVNVTAWDTMLFRYMRQLVTSHNEKFILF